MFLIDMAWDLNQMYDELDRLPREGWNHFKQNLNFLFEANPQSYRDRVERAAKVVFGDNWKLSPLVGQRFTQEEVRAQQPDTEDYQDPDSLDPTVFPAEPRAASSAAAREGVPPKVKPPPPGLIVQTPTVKLSSAPPKAMPAEITTSSKATTTSKALVVSKAPAVKRPQLQKHWLCRKHQLLPKCTKPQEPLPAPLKARSPPASCPHRLA